MFESVDEVQKRLRGEGYICTRNVATVVYLATQLEKPVLVEGPAGVGKTELSKVVAGALGYSLIRLQCYEGLDEAKALYEWEYSKQLLYTQMLRDKIGEILAGARTLRDASERIALQDDIFFSEKFIVPRPLLRAITADHPVVLLVDEVDKSDPEFEAFLLEVLSDYTVSVPEIGTLQAKQIPVVFLTSNDSREMSDALKRRCLHLYIDFPSEEQEVAILNIKVEGVDKRLAQEVVQVIQRVRKLDLKKAPSISETLDWARALMALNVASLEDQLVQETLSVILKYERDIEKASTELGRMLREKSAQAKAEKPAPPSAPAAKKSALH